LVAKCETHGRYFTVYPFGYHPYARVKLLQVDPEGQAIAQPEGSADKWQSTLGQATQDATRDIIWSRSLGGDYESATYWTQRRHVDRLALLLGLGLEEPSSELVRQALGIPTLVAKDTAAGWNAARTMKDRARQVYVRLQELAPMQGLLAALYSAGVHSGLWDRVWAKPRAP
jgi:hypothetical protein